MKDKLPPAVCNDFHGWCLLLQTVYVLHFFNLVKVYEQAMRLNQPASLKMKERKRLLTVTLEASNALAEKSKLLMKKKKNARLREKNKYMVPSRRRRVWMTLGKRVCEMKSVPRNTNANAATAIGNTNDEMQKAGRFRAAYYNKENLTDRLRKLATTRLVRLQASYNRKGKEKAKEAIPTEGEVGETLLKDAEEGETKEEVDYATITASTNSLTGMSYLLIISSSS